MTAFSFSLYDSYKRQTVTFDPETTVKPGTLKMYSCGPTVYNYQHIGNLRAAWFADTIARTARLLGWEVEWVMNITDVGHLVGDGDDSLNVTEGEDKIEKAARSGGRTVEEIVTHYTEDYLRQTQALGLDVPSGRRLPRATEYIEEQMQLALNLLQSNRAYLLADGIYFDSAANADINPFPAVHGDHAHTGRDIKNTTKHPGDFALWKFVGEDTLQKWKFNHFDATAEVMIRIQQANNSEEYLTLPNRWGTPGWHSECVAMICKILNGQFPPQTTRDQPVIDLHLGGEDHIDIHHKNEILQSRASGFELSRAWVHNKFVTVENAKMSKSKGNIYRLQADTDSITARGFDPLAYRLLLFEHHYTEQLNFTWDKLEQAQARLYKLRKESAQVRSYVEATRIEINDSNVAPDSLQTYLQNNLNTPLFLQKYGELLTETLNNLQTEKVDCEALFNLLKKYDEYVLNLQLYPQVPREITKLAAQRKQAKDSQDYIQADQLRTRLQEQGWQVDDYKWGYGLWRTQKTEA